MIAPAGAKIPRHCAAQTGPGPPGAPLLQCGTARVYKAARGSDGAASWPV